MVVVAASLVMTLSAGSALAADGVVEINHVRALQGGVTAGDAAGYPVTLSEPGSYVLTGSLTLPDENTDGIEVTADDVSIDLNGFAIEGPVTCTGEPVSSCSPLGSGDGIDGYTSSAENVSVRNGSIRGAGNEGISLRSHSEVENVRVSQSGNFGIYSYGASRIRGNSAIRNGAQGIFLYEDGSLVEDNVVRGNGSDGITVFGGFAASIVDNVLTDNGGYGLEMSTQTGWKGNVLRDNALGATNGSGVQLGSNLCGGTLCP